MKFLVGGFGWLRNPLNYLQRDSRDYVYFPRPLSAESQDTSKTLHSAQPIAHVVAYQILKRFFRRFYSATIIHSNQYRFLLLRKNTSSSPRGHFLFRWPIRYFLFENLLFWKKGNVKSNVGENYNRFFVKSFWRLMWCAKIAIRNHEH